jgi:general stress protein 26
MSERTAEEADMAAGSVERALAAARETIAKPRYCWAVTASGDGGANARGMQRLTQIDGDEWTVWFLTDGRSRKAQEVRRSGRMTIGFAEDTEGSFVALLGEAALVEDRSVILRHWRESWNRFFEGGRGDPNAVFIKVEVGRIELCVDNGTWSATLERDASWQWRLLSESRLGGSAR